MLSPAVYSKFARFVAKISSNGFQKYGWDVSKDDDHLGRLARSIFIRLQARFAVDNISFLNEAVRRFHEYCDDPIRNSAVLSSDFIISIFRLVLKTGDRAIYNKLKNLYGKLENNIDRRNVLFSLGFTGELALKTETMQWAVATVPLQDFSYALESVHLSGPAGRAISWTFFKQNISAIKKKIGSANPVIIYRTIAAVTSQYSSRKKAEEIEMFLKENPITAADRKISQILEKIRNNAKFFDNIKKSPAATEKIWDERF